MTKETTNTVSAAVRLAITETEGRVTRAVDGLKNELTEARGIINANSDRLTNLEEGQKTIFKEIRSIWWKIGLIIGGATAISVIASHVLH